MKVRLDCHFEEDIMSEIHEKIEEEIISGVDSHAFRLKECLTAIRMAGIQLDLLTASALQELSARIMNLIGELADES